MISLRKLGLIALCGFPCCIGAYHLFRTKVSKDIKSTRIYEEAIGALKGHRGAVFLLGQPIEDFRAQFNSMGHREERRMDVKIPVSGPKSTGVLFYSTVGDEKGETQLDTVQLQVGKDSTKRLVIKKSRNEISSNSSNGTINSSSNHKSTNSSENETNSSFSNNKTTTKSFSCDENKNASLDNETKNGFSEVGDNKNISLDNKTKNGFSEVEDKTSPNYESTKSSPNIELGDSENS